MVRKAINTIKYLILIIISLNSISCEKKQLENDRQIAQEQLNGRWLISKIETNNETVNNSEDYLDIEVWDNVKNGNSGILNLSVNNVKHVMNMGRYGVSDNNVINISLDVDWTSSLLSHKLYSNFNTELNVEVNSLQLIITKILQTNDGAKIVFSLYATKQ